MIKSVSLIIAGLLLLYRAFSPTSSVFCFYCRRCKSSDSEVDAAFALFSHARRRFYAGTGGGNTFDGEYQRKDDDPTALIIKTIARINVETPDYVLCHFPAFFVLAETAITPPACQRVETFPADHCQ